MRYTLSILAIIFVSIQLMAQYPTRTYPSSNNMLDIEQFSFGLRLSPSISWVDIVHNEAVDKRAIADGAAMKFGVGIVADYEINSIVSVISGINYNNSGGYLFDNVSLNDPSTKDNYRVNYNVVEVPLGLRLQTKEAYKKIYYIQGGVSASFILSANEKRKSSAPNTQIPALDVISITNPSAVGYFGTIGVEFRLARSLGLFVEVSYKNSLSSYAIGDKYTDTTTDLYVYHQYTKPIDIRPASMDFSVGIMF